MTPDPTEAEDIDWDGVKEPMARQILQQAETRLQAQLQAALASDARAMTVASVLITLATATTAAALAYWDKAGNLPILIGGLVAAAFMLAGAAFGVWAARPTDFYFPGNQPEKWIPIRKGNLIEALGGEAENQGQRIAINDELLVANAKALTRAALLAVAAPLAGVIAGAVTFYSCG
jgi:hypothetical protein